MALEGVYIALYFPSRTVLRERARGRGGEKNNGKNFFFFFSADLQL
jgi:hypothetical protein